MLNNERETLSEERLLGKVSIALLQWMCGEAVTGGLTRSR